MDDKMALHRERCSPRCTKSWWIKLLWQVLGGRSPPPGSTLAVHWIVLRGCETDSFPRCLELYTPDCAASNFDELWAGGEYIASKLKLCTRVQLFRARVGRTLVRASEEGGRGAETSLDFEIWYFLINVSEEKCFSLSFELAKWNFTTVGYPLEKSTIAPPWKESSRRPFHVSEHRRYGLVARWLPQNLAIHFHVCFLNCRFSLVVFLRHLRIGLAPRWSVPWLILRPGRLLADIFGGGEMIATCCFTW